MKHHRRIFANTTIVTVEVGLGIEQKIGDVHREHQEQLALTTINGAIGTTEQQDQGGQNIEQGGEEDVEVSNIGSREP
ncbi:hypothetical protein D3C81_1108190 [compost metagenome]